MRVGVGVRVKGGGEGWRPASSTASMAPCTRESASVRVRRAKAAASSVSSEMLSRSRPAACMHTMWHSDVSRRV
eukprot:scaffold66011_cov54-Phaeocystis_antarctica.AAC.1